ncbi:trypsin, alkaline C-like [Anticarsia gemmatalis]|uniref:trypsin, alkaline C-like n=1 Tax=Anticarsia gemmatalis TaxID=129554 RepID=UPI003F76AEB8
MWRPPNPELYRIRVGSTYANSGGTTYNVNSLLIHPDYREGHDVALMRIAGFIVYSNVVQPAPIAGPNYPLRDDEEVWATGWGAISMTGPSSEELRHVQVWSINQDICSELYRTELGEYLLCTGWLEVGGRDHCFGDSGGPVYHHGVVVGISHGGSGCGIASSPGLNMRISYYSRWIQDNA